MMLLRIRILYSEQTTEKANFAEHVCQKISVSLLFVFFASDV